ncbi:hypothetical protein SAMN05192558_11786 [Actinokineospora alba]|uniref:Uncharacterized protein n=1 Tax=Actinokineospora alba TaxID=504798 RepID=A0A1H0W4C8_9PSEU|nr:hypothetical protein [Actinokineospora alba]TDP67840.1 hypothetical protein C8E96_3394 [Actinokineospora alba]SDI72748.1 hypothetical protein SAMN05421871_10786 [Actinokineospora alba]SDP85335.1 hypothetical protein SAMN05192558_11786 [Actinokineospora alba]
MTQPPHRPQGAPQPNWQPGQPPQQGQYPPHQGQYQQDYQQGQYWQEAEPQRRPEYRAPASQQRVQAPAARAESSSSGFRIPGIGLILTLLGSAVQLLCLTVLPWASQGNDPRSLFDLWETLSNGGANSFGDWYVLLFTYPLMILGVLLSFAAVLESVAMKVVWAGLMLLGMGYLLLRYGLGPLTGSFGEHEFGTMEIVVALVAVAGVVLVVFVLKTAVSMFRRVAGLVLIGLSGVHVFAVMDLQKASDLSDLSVGAFGPTLGYLLVGVAALIGPRRLVSGL